MGQDARENLDSDDEEGFMSAILQQEKEMEAEEQETKETKEKAQAESTPEKDSSPSTEGKGKGKGKGKKELTRSISVSSVSSAVGLSPRDSSTSSTSTSSSSQTAMVEAVATSSLRTKSFSVFQRLSSQMTEYLVSSDKYLAALERPWFTEQRFQLWMLEAGGESFWSEGFIVGIAKQERQFRGVLLPWEVLQVDWDDGSTENHA